MPEQHAFLFGCQVDTIARHENFLANKALTALEIERVADTTFTPYVAVAELFHAPLLTYDAKMANASGARCTFEVFPATADPSGQADADG
jgi:hypothetical protein